MFLLKLYGLLFMWYQSATQDRIINNGDLGNFFPVIIFYSQQMEHWRVRRSELAWMNQTTVKIRFIRNTLCECSSCMLSKMIDILPQSTQGWGPVIGKYFCTESTYTYCISSSSRNKLHLLSHRGTSDIAVLHTQLNIEKLVSNTAWNFRYVLL